VLTRGTSLCLRL